VDDKVQVVKVFLTYLSIKNGSMPCNYQLCFEIEFRSFQ
jgi:hypothetical protein